MSAQRCCNVPWLQSAHLTWKVESLLTRQCQNSSSNVETVGLAKV